MIVTSRIRHPWTEAETADLIRWWRAEASIDFIARNLDRSQSACVAKANRVRDEGVDLPLRNSAGRVPVVK